MKLYYAKGSSALAPHILLLEAGVEFEAVEVSIPKGEHQTEAFLAVNSKGRVPVLETPEGILTENPAILEYIATTYSSKEMLPKGAFAQASARALMSYICSTVHVAFAHKQRGRRWVSEEASIKDMQAHVSRNVADCARVLDEDLPLSPWAMGESYSYCDAYLFLVQRWMGLADVPLAHTPKLAAHTDAMLARPATQKALKAHGLA